VARNCVGSVVAANVKPVRLFVLSADVSLFCCCFRASADYPIMHVAVFLHVNKDAEERGGG